MNIHQEISEVEENRDNLKKMADDVLDLYKKYPKQCNKLLKEIVLLDGDLDTIEKELEVLKDEVY